MKKTVVALICLLTLIFSSFPVLAQTAQELEDELLGTVSAQYESNGDPGLISGGDGDLGGASYGAYQFASTYNIPYTFAEWCVSTGLNKTVGNTLLAAYEKDGNQLGTNFNTAWKKIATDDKDGFLKLQRLYVKAKYYDPAVTALKTHFNLDVSLYGIAFKNAVWSRTLQHGLGSYDRETGFLAIVKRVDKNTAGGLNALSEEGLINAVYEESGGLTNSGTNAMTAANAGGNAWIIRTYNLEGKYMKYFSGNSAAVQAGVYLRLRVKEIGALLEMLSVYGGYTGEENGRRTPYLKENRLILTECDTITGFYSSSNVALSISTVDKQEGKGALNFVPLSLERDVSWVLKCKSIVDYSSFSHLSFQLFLPNVVWNETASLIIKGVVENKEIHLNTIKLSSLKSGWQSVSLSIPKEFSAQSLEFSLLGLPQSVEGSRFMLDYITAVPKVQGFDSYKVVADALHCRSGPSGDYSSLGLFPQNAQVMVVAKQNGWYLCSGTTTEGKVVFGWSSGGYLQQLVGDFLFGDVNGDHQISALDALQILRFAVGKQTLTEKQKFLADLNTDEAIDAKDALRVLQIAVHKVH